MGSSVPRPSEQVSVQGLLICTVASVQLSPGLLHGYTAGRQEQTLRTLLRHKCGWRASHLGRCESPASGPGQHTVMSMPLHSQGIMRP